MLFNSLQFVAFFAVVTPLYFVLPGRFRWLLLLAASVAFYLAFVPAYILVLLPMVLVNFSLARAIERTRGTPRRVLLALGVAATCLVLLAFKYTGFCATLMSNLTGGSASPGPNGLANIIVPIGLSFQTFQSLSYLIEVYRGRQKAETHLGIYSLYVLFYPKLVAGPIERPQHLLPQLRDLRGFDWDDFLAGLGQIAWGFFAKMVVADRVARYVNPVYGSWQTQTGLTLLIATLLFAVQIYADFSGYSSIAIGCARVMGVRLTRNFHHPYFATGVADFWHRWHITLSTWFRDYVYIPLGRSRAVPGRHYLSLLATFVLSGVWHGAGWTYVVWGAYNGLLLAGETALNSRRLFRFAWTATLRRVVALPLLIAGWVWFRADSLTAATTIYRKIATQTALTQRDVSAAVLQFTGDNSAVAVMLTTVLLIAAMFTVEFVREADAFGWSSRFTQSRRWQTVGALVVFEFILFFGILQPSAFIYRQF
jgi:alginate O-acetyltransferase complex protein AlgI